MDENTQISLWPLGLFINVNVGRARWARYVRLLTRSTELVRLVMMIVFPKALGDDRREIKNDEIFILTYFFMLCLFHMVKIE